MTQAYQKSIMIQQMLKKFAQSFENTSHALSLTSIVIFLWWVKQLSTHTHHKLPVLQQEGMMAKELPKWNNARD